MDIQLTENAIRVLQQRYLARNEKGLVMETPVDMLLRVAKAVAGAEVHWGGEAAVIKWQEIFFDALSQLHFLPNSPTLMNAGTPVGQLSACFVLPVPDSIDGIFSTLRQTALIQQSGGGTGFNFSHVRPENDYVSSHGGIASGPVSFMRIFNAATENIRQGGRRRGANMGILNVDHPDIQTFVSSKITEGQLSGFNISVGVTDEFMMAVERNAAWQLKHPVTGKVVKAISAQQLWDEIIYAAWSTGDPGLIFLDTINSANPTPGLGRIEATNPCGEVPLLPYEACNLASVNLTRFVTGRKGGDGIDWDSLEKTIKVATRFLDDVIEVSDHLFPEITTMVKGNRKIGLGVMGWADLLLMLEIPYDDDAAITLAHKLMGFFQRVCYDTSAELAAERGTFPNWSQSIFHPGKPMRNATMVSIAPTGSISLIAGVSSSIEPLFALAFRHRQVADDMELTSVNTHFLTYIEKHHLDIPEVIGPILESGVAGSSSVLPDEVRRLFKTALEIDPAWHLKHQAVFQQYTDNAVSKTINLPQGTSREAIDDIYMNAWRSKLKGITVFRYSSRQHHALYTGAGLRKDGCKVCVAQV
ncbi:adenosylcobalamin-dependent ribonucleoside-diphosphate reductase [Chitinophaga agri]|uniref:adenosylcobalamin-dependent ribonucleoside-diphosphate reductase n=1 Tax=Chitinophaga agri TaxID=2703787 RepID=UPI00192EE3CD|nr:adenosylcobalamin-dependent ribonucleoside-diphosphate reductase [Chitinophaga agri]